MKPSGEHRDGLGLELNDKAEASANGLDFNHAVDALAAAGAPWWGIAAFIIILMFFWRGPALIRSVNDFVTTQRQLTHKHQVNMTKLRSGARQKIEQQPGRGGRR